MEEKKIDLGAGLWTRVVRLDDGAGNVVSSSNPFRVIIQPGSDASASVTLTPTNAATGSGVLKASPGYLLDYNFCAGASAGFLMFFNSTTVPSDGVVTPAYVMPVGANGGFDVQLMYPRRFNVGISWAFSTTGPYTKTVSNTAFLAAQVL